MPPPMVVESFSSAAFNASSMALSYVFLAVSTTASLNTEAISVKCFFAVATIFSLSDVERLGLEPAG